MSLRRNLAVLTVTAGLTLIGAHFVAKRMRAAREAAAREARFARDVQKRQADDYAEINHLEERLKSAREQMNTVIAKIDRFHEQQGRYPTPDEFSRLGLGNDPWGYPWIYIIPGRNNADSYDLRSSGHGMWPEGTVQRRGPNFRPD